jgi:hypothetical protein
MALFLLSGPELGSRPGMCVPHAAIAREEQARLERLCGISPRSRLLYFAAVLSVPLFEFGS